MPAIFPGDFSSCFFVFRKNAHTPAICHHFVTFGAIFVDVCALFVACFSFCWRPRHFAWTLLTQFGAFFLGLGAQGQNVMKPVSQGTLNVRFDRIQGSPLGCAFVHFSGFVILLKLCSRAGGSAFLRVWVGPDPVFLHTGRL